jgi:hypothetical protein
VRDAWLLIVPLGCNARFAAGAGGAARDARFSTGSYAPGWSFFRIAGVVVAGQASAGERGDPAHGEQRRDIVARPDGIARELTIWLAARDYPGRAARRSNTDF